MKSKVKNGNRKLIKKTVLLIILLVVVVFIICKLILKGKEKNIIINISQSLINKTTSTENNSNMNNVIITNEGIKVNVSPKIYEQKKIKNITVKDMNISSQNDNTTIIFTIVNNSNKELLNVDYTIKFITNTGKLIEKVTGTISKIDANSEQFIYLKRDTDLSNAYDYNFKY